MTNRIMFCVCLTLAISVLQIVLEAMSKRTPEESGEERVTAKPRPMMNLIARAPSTLSSSASESPGKRSYESHSPLMIERRDPLFAVTQVTRKATTRLLKARTHGTNGTMTKLGLLKSGKLMK